MQSSTPFLSETSTSEIEKLDTCILPSSCFSGNQQKTNKKRKIDPVETAFHKMNNTLGTMAEACFQRKAINNQNDNNADVLIGKLVTVELQATVEPHKSDLKCKFMEILYFSKP